MDAFRTSPLARLGAALGIGLVVGLAVGATVLAGHVPSGSAPGTAVATVAPSQAAGSGIAASGTVAAGSTGVAIAQPAPAIAYPYWGYPGAPTVAPDGTIVVSGSGSAALPENASAQARSAAEKSAVVAALADARTRAQDVAGAAGLTLGSVYSISVEVAPSGPIVYPMMGAGGSSSGSSPAGSPTVPQSVPPVRSGPIEVAASVTVAYRIGG